MARELTPEDQLMVERLRRKLRDKTYHGRHVPMHICDGIVNYIVHRKPPGEFLHAVLCNDLTKAVMHADALNLANVGATALFLYNEAPGICRGSPDTVKRWLAGT